MPSMRPMRMSAFPGCVALLIAASASTASEPLASNPREVGAREVQAAVRQAIQEPDGGAGAESGGSSPAPAGAGNVGDWFWGVSVGLETAARPSRPGVVGFDHPLFGSEPGEFDARYRKSPTGAFEASMGYRVQGRLAVAVTLSRSSGDLDVEMAAELPHPFFFDRPRSVQGTVGSPREQLSAHLSWMWRIREGRKLEFAVLGGPSWIEFEQGVVVGASFDSEYPYNEAALTGPELLYHSTGTNGLHLGAEVAWWFRPRTGLVGTARHVHAPEEFELPDGTRLDLDAGGLQVSVGIRRRF